MNDVGPHDLDGLLVVAALRDDEVGIALCRLDELFVHGLQDVEIAVEHHLSCAASFYCVALDDTYEALVRVGIDEYLQVHEVAQLLLPERHNAFDDDDFARLDMHRFRQAVADNVAVSGLLDALPLSQGLYLLRQGSGQLEQLTQDHSYVEDLVREGTITREEAKNHPQRNMLTRAVGAMENLLVDTGELAVAQGDTFLLATDGLMKHMTDEEITRLLQQGAADPAQILVQTALNAGGRDNVTVVVVSLT